MLPERPFRNATALSFLLLGLALMFVSLGLILDAVLQMASAGFAVFQVLVLVTGFLLLAIGFFLVRARPQLWSAGPAPTWSAATGLRNPIRFLCLVVLLIGAILLVPQTAYERNAMLAAVLFLAGAFGLLATILWERPDVNVRATGAILAFLAGALLLYAQLTAPSQAASASAPFGPVEALNLVLPPLFGAIAICVASAAGFVYLYVADPRKRYATFILLGLAALVYGLGLTIRGLASFFDYPWGSFAQATASEGVLLIAFIAGVALLTAAGVAILAASLVSWVRSAQILRGSLPTPYLTTVDAREAQPATPTTTTTARLVD